MKAASVSDIKKELQTLPPSELLAVCLRLAKFKVENKELLTYLLFEAGDVRGFIATVKEEIDEAFTEISMDRTYLAKKKLRKIIRITNKYIRYMGNKEAEPELLLYICQHMKDAYMVNRKNIQVQNVYMQLLKKSVKAIAALHPDLQYDFIKTVNELEVDL